MILIALINVDSLNQIPYPNHVEGKITKISLRRAFFLNSGQKLFDPDWLRRFILSIRTKYGF